MNLAGGLVVSRRSSGGQKTQAELIGRIHKISAWDFDKASYKLRTEVEATKEAIEEWAKEATSKVEKNIRIQSGEHTCI